MPSSAENNNCVSMASIISVQALSNVHIDDTSQSVDPKSLEPLWLMIDDALTRWFQYEESSCTKNSVHKACSALCYLGLEPELFQRVQSAITAAVGRFVQALSVSDAENLLPEATLRAFPDPWLVHLTIHASRFNEAIRRTEIAFSPLVYQYIMNSDAQSIKHLVHTELRLRLEDTDVPFHWTHSITTAVNTFRSSQHDASSLAPIASAVSFIRQINMFRGSFKETVIFSTRTFYNTQFIRTLLDEKKEPFSTQRVLDSLMMALDKETSSITPCFFPATSTKLRSAVLEATIKSFPQQLLTGFDPDMKAIPLTVDTFSSDRHLGLYSVMVAERSDTVQRLYALYTEAHSVSAFHDVWQQCVQVEVARILRLAESPLSCVSNTDAQQSKSFSTETRSVAQTFSSQSTKNADRCSIVIKLIDWKQKLARLQSTAFTQAWTNAMNSTSETEHLSATLLAEYTDMLLAQGQYAPAEPESSQTQCIAEFEHVIDLLKFIHAKDLYRVLYARHLERRLLTNCSSSHQMELSMIAKLRDECGPAFTQKMEDLLQELSVSETLVATFLSDVQAETLIASTGITFDCHVLPQSLCSVSITPTTGKKESRDIRLPAPLSVVQNAFSSFYQKHQKGRKLLWNSPLATCCVRARFGTKSRCKAYDLLVSQTQAVCLLLFNDATELSLADMARLTHLDDAELEPTLSALVVDPACRVLLKTANRSSDGENAATVTYCVNNAFVSHLNHIAVPQAAMKDSKYDVEKSTFRAEEDLSLRIDACIVRSIKASQRMHHDDLVQCVLDVCDAAPVLIEERIKSLIDREFFDVDKKDPDTFLYATTYRTG